MVRKYHQRDPLFETRHFGILHDYFEIDLHLTSI